MPAPLCIVNAMLGRGRGGLEQAALDYHAALQGLGHDVHSVIHPAAAIRPGLEALGAAWHGLPQLGAWDVVATLRLRRLLRHLEPHLCIAHGNRAMSLLRLAGADPVIAVLPNYKMKCAGAAAVFYPTHDLMHYARGQGVPDARMHHVPSMVAVPPTAPLRNEMHHPPVIGAMGRFVAKKGFDVLIDALACLRAEGVMFHAVLAGDGPERAALEHRAATHHLHDVLSFPGWVEDKPGFFSTIDIFCLPSHHEPFGIVLIEAMANAVPIVATDSEGPSEILASADRGLLVPRGDSPRLAQALAALIADPVRARRLGTHAYRHALETFSVEQVGKLLSQIAYSVAKSVKTGQEFV